MHLPASQSFSFQNGDASPFSLHSFHTVLPVDVHHHHLVPLAGFSRLAHWFSPQKGDASPFSLHWRQSWRPSLVQNHQRREYLTTSPPEDELELDFQLRNFARKPLRMAAQLMIQYSHWHYAVGFSLLR